MRSGRRERRNIHLISRSSQDKAKEGKPIHVCRHFERLTADERRGIILDLLCGEDPMAFRPPRLVIPYPDGVGLILCRRCYGKGSVTVRDGKGNDCRLRWAVGLDVFKMKDVIREANTHPTAPEGKAENLDLIKHLIKRLAMHQACLEHKTEVTNRWLLVLSIVMAIGAVFAILQYFKN